MKSAAIARQVELDAVFAAARQGTSDGWASRITSFARPARTAAAERARLARPKSEMQGEVILGDAIVFQGIRPSRRASSLSVPAATSSPP